MRSSLAATALSASLSARLYKRSLTSLTRQVFAQRGATLRRRGHWSLMWHGAALGSGIMGRQWKRNKLGNYLVVVQLIHRPSWDEISCTTTEIAQLVPFFTA